MLRKHLYLFVLFFVFSRVSFAQDNQVLFKIDGQEVYASEFTRMYNKQMEMLGEDTENSKEDYFRLFLEYKLKVKVARDLKLDTVASYKKELQMHKDRLVQSYLRDPEANEALIEEAYQRSITEVNASHILIQLPKNAPPQDTLDAYNRISDLRSKILNGANFELMARMHSDDPSAQQNGGNLGYFSAFKMVYPFESAAYNTEVGAISKPFRSAFGYHIIKTLDFRESQGAREVAHIMLRGDENIASKRIDSLYNVLKVAPEKFEALVAQFSEDNATKNKGGVLPRIEIGDTLESFEEAAFKMEEEGSFSQPFKTEYGWHIIKLIKSYPVPTKEELYPKLKGQVMKGERSKSVQQAVIKKLESQYKIFENLELVSDAISGKEISESSKKLAVLSIEDTDYTLEEFIVFLKSDKNLSKSESFKKFKEAKLLEYHKDVLFRTIPELQETLTDFEEGLLIFNIMEQEVWNPSKNVSNQQAFYASHKENYERTFREVQGAVISDYQNYLEEQWVLELNKQHEVEVISKELSKVLNE